MRPRFTMFRRGVRYRCETCGACTVWFNRRRLLDLGETVETWGAWWRDLHYGVAHQEA